MMLKKMNVLSSYALAATVTLFVVLINGCDRRDEVYPVEGNAYMHDPEFNAVLKKQVKDREQITDDLMKQQERYQKLVAKYNGDVNAATNTAEGIEIVNAIRECEDAFISNRRASADIIRERHKRAVEDSQRIKRGEAKAIDISKKEEK